jgi:hypothetical protein
MQRASEPSWLLSPGYGRDRSVGPMSRAARRWFVGNAVMRPSDEHPRMRDTG